MKNNYSIAWNIRINLIIVGIICCVTLVGIPVGVVCIYLAFSTLLTTDDQGMTLRTIGTKTFSWSDLDNLKDKKFLPALLIGGFKNTKAIGYRIKSENKNKTLPVGYFNNREQLLAEFQKRVPA